MIDNEVIINVEHLTKDYGYGRGVFDVSIKVPLWSGRRSPR